MNFRSKSLFSPLAVALLAAVFATPTLHAEDLWQAYELARASDPQLQLADAQRKSSEEGIEQARSALLPQIGASAGYTKSQSDSPLRNFNTQTQIGTTDGKSGSSNYGARIDQTIYDHANYTRLKAARAQAESAAATYKAAEQALIVRVATSYFQVLTAQDSLTSAQAEEKAVGRQLEQAEQRYNVGLTAITDVHEARARHDGAVAAAILSENALDDALAALTELTGKNIAKIASVQEKIPLEGPAPADWQSWVDNALKFSPTLAARTAELNASQAQIETAKAARYPTISSNLNISKTTGTREGNSPTLAGGIVRSKNDINSDDSSIGIDIRIPLFSGFNTSSRIRQAVLDSEASKDRLEQERRAITRQTRNAYRSVIAGVSEVKARQQALVSAKSALEATEAGFEVGTRTIVDVLLSQQVLFQAQRDYSQARHNFLVNGLRLKSSAGTITPEDLKTTNALLTEAH
jgi:outer membrane protein